MSPLRQALLVAGWEFRRYFKWRDQVLGLLVFLVIAGLGYVGGRLANAGERRMTVAVDGVDVASLESAGGGGRLAFVALASRPQAEADLREGSLHGILTRDAADAFSLLVERDPRHRGELSVLLDSLVQRERLAARGMHPSELQQLMQPARLDLRFTNPHRGRVGRGEIFMAAIAGALVLMAIFTSMAYLLTGITGEKQLRVTESTISFVHPQAWIDGKILGIGAYGLVNILNMAVGVLLLALVAGGAWGFSLPAAAVRPSILLLLLVCSGLALLLWNAFFAAFAATIDDPNTSARTSVMFLPMLFVGMALWVVLRDPDSLVSRGMALFPLTSSVALPARAILSEVGPLEILLSLMLQVATIGLVRRAAGRVVRAGMLMYGKEPSVREMVGLMWRG
jgi:ABC-2 type transport system permease protein